MVNYVVIRKNGESSESIVNTTYGICACSFNGGVLEIKNCVYDISNDVTWLKSFADMLNQYDVDPIHLGDIIEDELYSTKT